MTAGTRRQERLVIRQISDRPAETAYFERKALAYAITNISLDDLLMECGTLQLEPDMETAPNYVEQRCGFILAPQETKAVTFGVTPTPIYKENTNQIRIRFEYRLESEGRLGDIIGETHEGFYLIIHTPTPNLGDVFISFKQPEDQKLAVILERYSKRAGFTPHLFVRNPGVGADQWKTIERLIKSSHSAFIVWARRTDWGGGVEREITICRDHNVRELLLIERGVDVPAAYKGTAIAFQYFDPQEPTTALSEAVSSLRNQVIE